MSDFASPFFGAALSGFVLSFSGLTGCGNADSGTTKDDKSLAKITLNEVAHSVFYAPMYVAIEEGYFAEESCLWEMEQGAFCWIPQTYSGQW